MIFDTFDVTASASLGAPFGGLTTGMLSGGYDWSATYEEEWPSGFDPSSCARAMATDTWGFGIHGNLNMEFNGAINAATNGSGFEGSISTTLSGRAAASIKWPCSWWSGCGVECVDHYTGYIRGDFGLSLSGGKGRVVGTCYVGIDGHEEDWDIDTTFSTL